MQGQDVTLRFGGNESLVIEGNSIVMSAVNIIMNATGQPEAEENIIYDLVRPMVRLMTFEPVDMSRGA
jgi:hypothetical protein